VVEDGVHLFRDWHLDGVASGETKRSSSAEDAFSNLAVETGDDVGQLAASAEFDSYGAVTRERAGAGKDEIADAGETG
jgi:hypothetical protein